MARLPPPLSMLAGLATGRDESLFAGDIEAHAPRIHECVAGRRILVVGGAGSVGSATTLELLRYGPRALAVLDPNENGLAELVRTVRSSASDAVAAAELDVSPLDYGSPLAERFLAERGPFDVVLIFAALKHVRSERDSLSVLRLLEVNLLAADRFLHCLRKGGHGQRGVFLISTDKAARPVSVMGASKRAVESLLWTHTEQRTADAPPPLPLAMSARFANVAFSQGSLTWSFLERLAKRQPLAAPGDVRRYLLTPEEAAQLCLLAVSCCPHRHLLIPKLSAAELVDFPHVARVTLEAYGLQAVLVRDEATARHRVGVELARGRYPLLVTRTTTPGEKVIEEFAGPTEKAVDIGLEKAHALAARPGDPRALEALLQRVRSGCKDAYSDVRRERLVELLGKLIADFDHRDAEEHLDQKL
ncbi:MAG: SDR family NAD(P)-dependent oxidoreductase [Deltaproteobacteria bacterium]|nr:MAG: SDR family NAD(P)-dependent oxidoreductase [Deltaproteobacteria bacterium]